MEKELKEKLVKALGVITPTGSRISVDGLPVERLVEVTCDGADAEMGYFCCLVPGHKDRNGNASRCWSMQKKIEFSRTN